MLWSSVQSGAQLYLSGAIFRDTGDICGLARSFHQALKYSGKFLFTEVLQVLLCSGFKPQLPPGFVKAYGHRVGEVEAAGSISHGQVQTVLRTRFSQDGFR